MAEVPECEGCKKPMKCLKNGIRIIFNGSLYKVKGKDDVRMKGSLKCGRGDLFYCDKCGTYAADGFCIALKGDLSEA